MRLIDADALKKDLKSVTLSNGTLVNTNAVLYLLEEYPTAYDVDKVVEQLEDRKSLMLETLKISEADIDRGRIYGMDKAIEIVKGGGADGN
jgi:hypothetical protein